MHRSVRGSPGDWASVPGPTARSDCPGENARCRIGCRRCARSRWRRACRDLVRQWRPTEGRVRQLSSPQRWPNRCFSFPSPPPIKLAERLGSKYYRRRSKKLQNYDVARHWRAGPGEILEPGRGTRQHTTAQRPGNALLFSRRAPSSSLELIPSTSRMVAAICRVSTSSLLIAPIIEGLETSRATLRSSLAKPPCSASFEPLV